MLVGDQKSQSAGGAIRVGAEQSQALLLDAGPCRRGEAVYCPTGEGLGGGSGLEPAGSMRGCGRLLPVCYGIEPEDWSCAVVQREPHSASPCVGPGRTGASGARLCMGRAHGLEQGRRTSAERDLDLQCPGYIESLDNAGFGLPDALTINAEKVPLLAARWSLDPVRIEEALLASEDGIAGEPSRYY